MSPVPVLACLAGVAGGLAAVTGWTPVAWTVPTAAIAAVAVWACRLRPRAVGPPGGGVAGREPAG
jgi:hypothetical protein